MKTNITARRIELPERVREHIETELDKIEKYYNGVYDCSVVAEKIREDFVVEIRANVYKQTLVTEDSDPDIIKAVDLAVDKLRRRLKKFKARIQGFDHVSPDSIETETD